MAPSVAPKRVNNESVHGNSDSNLVKKRKLESSGKTRGDRIANLSQQKSSFEGDLERLTQELKGGQYTLFPGEDFKSLTALPVNAENAEKDQQWERPPLVDFDPHRDNLTFQQIDAEEGTFRNRATVRLFGVTEVSAALLSTEN